jgi:hypothetical protein
MSHSLHDGIEIIEDTAFARCAFTNFRVPLLVTVIPMCMLRGCTSLFSVEIPLTVTEIRFNAFGCCHCLRNLALPPNAVIDNNTFDELTDLLQLFGSVAEIIRELKHRFDRLLIHCAVWNRIIRGHYNALLHQAMSWIQRVMNKTVEG